MYIENWVDYGVSPCHLLNVCMKIIYISIDSVMLSQYGFYMI